MNINDFLTFRNSIIRPAWNCFEFHTVNNFNNAFTEEGFSIYGIYLESSNSGSCIVNDNEGTNMNSSAITSRLEAEGGREVRVRGSHHYFKRLGSKMTVCVPHPKRASEILCPWDNRSPPNGCIQWTRTPNAILVRSPPTPSIATSSSTFPSFEHRAAP